MSDHDNGAAGEAARSAPGAKPSLLGRLRSLFGLGGASVRDDIQEALADATLEVDISPQERALLKNVLALHEVDVGDVMVPRADIAAVPLSAALVEVLGAFRVAGHSRLPVYGETLDDPRGMVHIRDFVAYLAEAAQASGQARAARTPTVASSGGETGPPEGEKGCRLDLSLAQADLLRPVLFVPPSMPALDLLVKMQATRTHMALVIDEYGGTEGLASIEDIMEVIVGDIEDEHDLEESPKIEPAAGGTFIADARADLTEVSQAIGADLTAAGDAGEVDTLGGLIVMLAGRVPARGEIIAGDGIEYEVLDADPRRIKRVKLRPAAGHPPPAQIEVNPMPGKLAGQSASHEK